MKKLKIFLSSWKSNLLLALIWLFFLSFDLFSLIVKLGTENHGNVAIKIFLVILEAILVLLYSFIAFAKFLSRNDDDEK